MIKVSGIGIEHYGIEYRRYSKQGIGIGIGHHGIVPSLINILLLVFYFTANKSRDYSNIH